ncbi:vWA domain-containing protein [Pararhizobium haloflavum]|uniref:vWA domain-containing protein n=1 Tax=Pararhizobium haloflavum TaxID=2037914 RepID=UPI000C180378|nr:TadE/TadG family type IV pilus assembly protein [Pararhizobium haloflavum]
MSERLLDDRRGNVAVAFAFCSLPLLAAAGLAVDYGSASSQRSAMRDASDGAALAVAQAGDRLTVMQAQEIAANFVEANYDGSTTKVTVSRAGNTWTVAMEDDPQLYFGDLLGLQQTRLGVVSSASYAFTSYEIGLVFDTNGGMEGEKLDSLKEAAISFVDQMEIDVGRSENLSFASVPFSTFVNVGPEYGPQFRGRKMVRGGARWLDVEGKNPVAQSELLPGLSRFEVFHHLGEAWDGCVETRVAHRSAAYDTADIPATRKDRRSLFVPAFSIDEPSDTDGRLPLYANDYLDDAGTDLTDSKADRLTNKYKIEMTGGGAGGGEEDDDDDDEDGGGLLGILAGLSEALFGRTPAVDDSVSTFYDDFRKAKGPNFDCASQPLLPLTSDMVAVKRHIASLEASGRTNMLEGMMWGWRVLSPGEPFTGGRPSSEGSNDKVVIFVSDGRNDWDLLPNALGSSYSSFGYIVDERLVSDDTPLTRVAETMDDKTLNACENAKADGVTIYTIRLERSDDETEELLKGCASSAAHYIDARDAGELDSAFERIRQRMRHIHISS